MGLTLEIRNPRSGLMMYCAAYPTAMGSGLETHCRQASRVSVGQLQSSQLAGAVSVEGSPATKLHSSFIQGYRVGKIAWLSDAAH